MARKAREISKSGNYYITLKGNELFVTDEDKKMFVEILEKNFATRYCTWLLSYKVGNSSCCKRG